MSYLYATGRIRVLENNLLSESTIERMIGAKNANEAYRALTETDYATFLDDFPQPQQVEELTIRHLRNSRLELQRMIGIEGPLKILWRKYDFHNLRSVIKIRAMNSDFQGLKNMLVPLGSRSRKEWLGFFENGEKGTLRKEWLRVYEQALQKYEKSNDPRDIDLEVDQEYFLALQKMTESYSSFFRAYVKRLIDIYNITLRIRTFEDKDFTHSFAPGGYLPQEIFQTTDKLCDRIAGTGKGYAILRESIRLCQEEKAFAQFEKAADNMLTEYLYRAKTISYGPEPVFTYWLAKKNNAMIIRTIITAKLAGLSQEQIRGYLRKVY